MVYTVTINPSLDYVMTVPLWKMGGVNRPVKEEWHPGGKGVNVSIMLTRLGMEHRALGFMAGFTGERIESMLLQEGCKTAFIRLNEGDSRINIKIVTDRPTEINGNGPPVPPKAVEALLKQIELLEDRDILVLAGSVPSELPSDMYERILRKTERKAIRTVVDAAGDLLIKTLPFHPFLIKPNHHELGDLFGVTVDNTERAESCARRLQAMGARNVLVSMEKEGALLIDETGEVHRDVPPKGQTVNAVGAGDSMVAGFLFGHMQTGDYKAALKLGVTVGSATAFSSWLAEGREIRALLENPDVYGL